MNTIEFLSIIVALLVIIYLYSQVNAVAINTAMNKNELDKENYLRPSSETIKKHPDYVDFMFNIQELYYFSPPNFEILTDAISDFLILYDSAILTNFDVAKRYELAYKKKSDSMNALHSLIYSIPVVEKNYYGDKIMRAIEQLDDMMSKMLSDMYDNYENVIIDNGYNTDTQVVHKMNHPNPNNYYQSDAYDLF